MAKTRPKSEMNVCSPDQFIPSTLQLQRDKPVKYSYRILGRSPGNTHPVLYSGTIEAGTSKNALIYALAKEFATNDSKPGDTFEALMKSGWLDSETLAEQICSLFDDDTSFCLDTGEHTFDVEVTTLPE